MGVTEFTPEEFLAILVSFIVTWGVGLLPAWVVRYRWKKAPLSKRSANWIAGLSCFFFAIAFLILRGALGEVNPRMSAVWVFVFFAQRWIMTRGSKSDEELVIGLRGSKSDEELVIGLQKMIADPATAEHRRQRAREKLPQLEAKIRKRAPRQHLAIGGYPQIAEQGRPAGHSPRVASSTLDHNVIAKRTRPRIGYHGSNEQESGSWRRYGRLVAYVAGVVVALDILLMISGYRVLVGEKIVPAGDRYQTAEWVYGSDDGPTIVCWHWTGRSVKEILHWYGQGRTQIDECPLLLDIAAGH